MLPCATSAALVYVQVAGTTFQPLEAAAAPPGTAMRGQYPCTLVSVLACLHVATTMAACQQPSLVIMLVKCVSHACLLVASSMWRMRGLLLPSVVVHVRHVECLCPAGGTPGSSGQRMGTAATEATVSARLGVP